MCFASFLTRPTLWIALAAILWASLAPSLAHALSLSPGGHHTLRISVDYCVSDGDTQSGLTLEVPRDGGDGSQADAHGDGHHCPLCRNPQAGVGILPAPVPVLPAPSAAPSPTRRCSSWRPIPFMPGARPSRAHRPRTKSAQHCRLTAEPVRACPPSPSARYVRARYAPGRVPSSRSLRTALRSRLPCLLPGGVPGAWAALRFQT